MKTSLIALALAAALPFTASAAEGLSYNYAEAGIRTAFGQHAEVYAMAGYEDYSKKHGVNPDGQFYGRLGGQVKLNQNWGINGDIKMDRHGDKEWSVGPRFSW